MRRTSALLSLLSFVGSLLAACAATSDPSGTTGDRLRVTLNDYVGGARFELVSESHTDRVAYYSNTRYDAARKIQLDIVMQELITELGRSGFGEFSREGRAPSRGGGVVTRSFEIQSNDGVEHWVVGSGSAPEQRSSFLQCTATFLELYNATQSFQAIENDAGTELFEAPKRGRT